MKKTVSVKLKNPPLKTPMKEKPAVISNWKTQRTLVNKKKFERLNTITSVITDQKGSANQSEESSFGTDEDESSKLLSSNQVNMGT